jgi:hypothetical protein
VADRSSRERSVVAAIGRLALGVVLAMAVGWATLALGGHTDAAGRTALALGAAAFVLVIVGWRRGRRGWIEGIAGAMVIGGAMLAHFWMRLGRLP